ncbi:50S ribosomal protein L31e [Candidatus Woesearchaeota archaeon]|nr:50S ribosomal protein L31e [Candidatus Woesearchaeota archaeon]
MAKKKEEKKAEIVLERVYTVPLRREWLKAPKYKRAAKAVRGLREFLMKHMKAMDVKIGKYLNEAIWGRGMKNPLHKVKVEAKKDEKGIVFAEIVGAPKEEKKEEKGKKGKEKKVEEKKEVKKEKVSEKKEEVKEKPKEEEPKEETKKSEEKK